MAEPRAFISFRLRQQRGSAHAVRGQATTKSPTSFAVSNWSSKEALPQKTWEQTIEARIARCHMMIVLVGKKTHSATGVKKEIAMAKKLSVPFRGVYVDGAGSLTTLPEGLSRSKTIAWTWPGVGAAIKAMKSEGKNAKR
jgi:MTH538 TIR-like domain (DUF1863)